MVKILAIDTATEICSVSLAENGENIGFKQSKVDYSHSALLTEFIEEVLVKSNNFFTSLDAIAISGGPGSYTGLRIGASTAKGLCFGLDIPIIAIDTNKIIAQALVDKYNDPQALYVGLIDARRMEVYAGIYDDKLRLQDSIKPHIIDDNSFDIYLKNYKIYFGGNGSMKCSDVIRHSNAVFDKTVQNSANHMGSLAFKYYQEKKFEDIVYYEPNYLKGVNISKSHK